jgi:hypothetical protein
MGVEGSDSSVPLYLKTSSDFCGNWAGMLASVFLLHYLQGISKPNAHSSEHFKGEKYLKNGAGLSTG